LVRQANAVDFWRGFALVTIFVNHIPGIYFERFTHRNISLSDSAELFVFLAGWALRLLVDRYDRSDFAQLIARLGARAVAIYAAQLLIISLAIAMLAAAATYYENPLILEWHNAAAVFYDPLRAHIGLVLLTHQLGYFDILPLYVVLMACAPLIVVLHRLAPGLLLPLSLALYLAALVWRLSVPTWPIEGHWFFNPLAWQVVFVLGYSLASGEGVGGFARRHSTGLRIAAVPILLAGATMALLDWFPDPTRMPEPKLLFIAQKSFLTPIRLVHFLASVALISLVFAHIALWLPRFTGFLALLGRNSLYVFCVGSLLSLAAQIIRYTHRGGGLALDSTVLIVGIILLGFTAWVSEQTKRGRPRAASRTETAGKVQ
jgi:hypothetical protein